LGTVTLTVAAFAGAARVPATSSGKDGRTFDFMKACFLVSG
jgi:hypothetical protein